MGERRTKRTGVARTGEGHAGGPLEERGALSRSDAEPSGAPAGAAADARGADRRLAEVNRVGDPWTADDDLQLTLLWGEHTLTKIAKKLGRNPISVYHHARKIGLRCGAPQGTEYLWRAALRTGYSVKQLRRIFEVVGGVRVRPAMSRPSGPRSFTHSCVEPLDVDAAIAAFIKTRETLSEAARRYSMKALTMRQRLVAAGVEVPDHCMPSLLRDDVDRAMRTESLIDAKRRLGCDAVTLRRALIEGGVKKRGRGHTTWMLPPEEYDRALAAHNERMRLLRIERGIAFQQKYNNAGGANSKRRAA